MSLHSNNFSQDDILIRGERYIYFSGNIDSLAVELGVTGDLLLWAQNTEAEWEEIRGEARVQKYDAQMTFGAFRRKQNETRALYVRAKALLKAIIASQENADEIIRAYSIDGKTPITREGILSSVDDLAGQNDIYNADGATWVLPDHIVDSLKTLRNEMSDLHSTARTKREKAKVARVAMQKRFREDTHRLKLIYEMGVLVWGVQGLNFLDLGMLPKSRVWTKHRPPAPANFRYDSSSRVIIWGAIEDADRYEAHYRAGGASGHWTAFYEGESNSCPLPTLTGAHEFRVRAIAKGKEGHWSGAVEVGL
ncbi:hypothetical protein KAH81_07705 [bacterium]|nr:hypothetical protein [bacterium]